MEKVVGAEAIEAQAGKLYAETFEAKADVYNVIYGESNAVVEFNFLGQHTGDFLGVSATGREVNVQAMAVYDVDGDVAGDPHGVVDRGAARVQQLRPARLPNSELQAYAGAKDPVHDRG